MRKFTNEEISAIYENRRNKLFDLMEKNSVNAVVFEDTEERRNPAVRYFSGHPMDALLIAYDRKMVLIPWDENLAKEKAVNIKIVPYNKYGRENVKAVAQVLKSASRKKKLVVELPPETPYLLFLKYVDALSAWDVRCREHSIHEEVVNMRSIKDEYEIECTKEACRIGDIIIEEIEQKIKSEEIKTESDVALLIEKTLRQNGCEKTGFDTLAAGPERSFAIHAFPGYTNASWPAPGLSILDFGVVYEGYTSDTTLTVAKEPLTEDQKKIVSLVQNAADECLKLYEKDIPFKTAASCADAIFAKEKMTMPHTLGHGIGLEIHEFPRVSTKQPEEKVFKPGMIITLEPGLYDPEIGGCRLENDVLITEEGNEVITHSKIIWC